MNMQQGPDSTVYLKRNWHQMDLLKIESERETRVQKFHWCVLTENIPGMKLGRLEWRVR